jgi:GNAT superfamily N-acetyltransferase
MQDGFNYRLYVEGDELQIVELLETVFNRWPSFYVDSPLEHWRWKYLDNPVIAKHVIPYPIITVCENKGQIIGVCHSVYFNAKLGDKIFLGCHGPDFAVHPDFRGRGISRKTRDFRYKHQGKYEIAFDVGLSENPIIIERNKRHGYPRFPHELAIYVTIRDVNKHMKYNPGEGGFLKKYGYLFFKKLNTLSRITIDDWSPQHQVSEISRFDYRADNLWDQMKDHYMFMIERDMDYLNWRYCDPRGGRFNVRVVEENDEILGYSVLSLTELQEGYPIGVIVDLVTHQTDLEIVSDLIYDAMGFFEKKNVNMIKMRLVRNHPFTKVLWKAGLVDTLRRPYAVYRALSEIDEHVRMFEDSKPSEVHYVYGDLDTL